MHFFGSFPVAAFCVFATAAVHAEPIVWQTVTSGSQQWQQPQNTYRPYNFQQNQQDEPRYGSDVLNRRNANGTTTISIGVSEFTSGGNRGNSVNYKDESRYGSDVINRRNANGTATTTIGGSEFTSGSNRGGSINYISQYCSTVDVSTICR